MAIIYEVTLKQLYHGQDAVNRWNFLGTGTPISVVPSFALLTAMGLIPVAGVFPSGTFGRLLAETQPETVTFVQALARTITDEHPTDFFDFGYAAGISGLRDGVVGMTPVNAYGFRTNRVRTDISRGTKRFVGVCEEDVKEGGEFEDAAQGQLNSLAALMTANLTYTTGGESLTFAPIVCKKEEYTVPSSGKRAYRYYSTQAAQQLHMAQGIVWQAYDTVRSQTSRQYDS